jgi:hypothetical protein
LVVMVLVVSVGCSADNNKPSPVAPVVISTQVVKPGQGSATVAQAAKADPVATVPKPTSTPAVGGPGGAGGVTMKLFFYKT